MTMMSIADLIENASRTLNEAEGQKRGIGFPTGLSLNNCAAHYTPNPGDTIGAPRSAGPGTSADADAHSLEAVGRPQG
jgi:methionine aminopeptidase